MSNTDNGFPVVVLISGGGTNLQAIIDNSLSGKLPVTIKAVISNRPDAYGLQRAGKANIPTAVLEHKDFADREAFDQALAQLIDNYNPRLVILAGFMRILSPEFVSHYAGRLLNIHPSLLPRHRGLHTHARVLEANEKEHGASVQFVTPELDAGPVILQARVPVLGDDTEEILASRVLEQEHRIYPQAVHWFAQGRVRLDDDQIFFDNAPLAVPLMMNDIRDALY